MLTPFFIATWPVPPTTISLFCPFTNSLHVACHRHILYNLCHDVCWPPTLRSILSHLSIYKYQILTSCCFCKYPHTIVLMAKCRILSHAFCLRTNLLYRFYRRPFGEYLCHETCSLSTHLRRHHHCSWNTFRIQVSTLIYILPQRSYHLSRSICPCRVVRHFSSNLHISPYFYL